MIGIYDYTVILTYISVMVSFVGMMLAADGFKIAAIVCLAISGLLDMFDGKVARTKKDRTEEGKKFGIQIDSLCDIVCFGAAPIVICHSIGIGSRKDIIGLIILLFYGVAGVIRLAYFNVAEEMRQQETTENRKYYQGLPITSTAVALPVIYMLRPMFTDEIFILIVKIMMLAVGTLFITDFKFKKPSNGVIAILVIIVASALLFTFTRQWHMWRMS